jgi:hypothetical protein
MTYAIENDGRFPDDSPVQVWYPPKGTVGTETPQRDEWAWLPGSILGQCGPDEWHVVVEVRELVTLIDGTPVPDGTTDQDLYYPACYRDASEIRPRAGEGR